jgi:hypothetical protein
MGRKFGTFGVLVAGFLAITMTAAHASAGDTASGQGKTPLDAALGFNAQEDLSGTFTYNSSPHGDTPEFKGKCFGYEAFSATSGDDSSMAAVTATCEDQDDTVIYLRAAFLDRGEPGFDDMVCIVWSYTSPPTPGNAYIHDHGVISNGNVQVKDR